jgi:branched-chain amino acid transport system substrate-binding protein
VVVIATAAEAARSDEREDILDALEAMEFDTWRGPVRFERGPAHWHHAAPEVLLLQYQSFGQTFDDSAIIYPPQSATAEYLATSDR